ncbi:hypothetical protein K461DRAFT_148094 [Myriangium duriaei CBS 260.36]|uniref:Tetratricopeptide repeat protein 1 n=1 Tax=Myriangium duriaei CBS 260.36 TaxID=1168546 RepID=A0A9P4MM92_9PEZI|nr:hypothetical protein K461DRAFT_148094 [Myriangium duriaei CBS 260.36]
MADDAPSDDDQSFRSARSRSPSPRPASKPPTTDRLPQEEESRLLKESSTLKTQGNSLFASSSFSQAISTYDRALSLLPAYIDYEPAVLRSNIAACHLKLGEWQEAVTSATAAVDGLERLDPVPKKKPAETDGEGKKEDGIRLERKEKVDVEEVDDDTDAAIQRLKDSGHTLAQVRKLRVKVLLRRAKARTEVGGWSALQGADEDYRAVLGMGVGEVGEMDRRMAQGALAALGPRLDEARQTEMAEMMGKLKGLGNSLLKPFGLSTENFQFVKDEKTGGYSMNFNQNR